MDVGVTNKWCKATKGFSRRACFTGCYIGLGYHKHFTQRRNVPSQIVDQHKAPKQTWLSESSTKCKTSLLNAITIDPSSTLEWSMREYFGSRLWELIIKESHRHKTPLFCCRHLTLQTDSNSHCHFYALLTAWLLKIQSNVPVSGQCFACNVRQTSGRCFACDSVVVGGLVCDSRAFIVT